jgi:hypothetical protein
MAYASMALADANVRFPHVRMPNFRWPRLSRRARALLMMGIMISPAFLADDIGYCVQRLFLTADQIAVRQVPDRTMLSRVNIFHVACIDENVPAAEREHLAGFAAQQGWPRYPEAGPGCFNPNRNMLGIVGLKSFNVACPTIVLSVADQRRWVAFAENHGWTSYPQAGEGCVDP